MNINEIEKSIYGTYENESLTVTDYILIQDLVREYKRNMEDICVQAHPIVEPILADLRDQATKIYIKLETLLNNWEHE